MRVAHPLQRLRSPVLDAYLFIQSGHGRKFRRRGPTAREPCGEPVVGKLRMIENGSPVNVGSRNRPVGRNHHFHHNRQPFLSFAQRREVGRQFLRQHRKYGCGGVDGRGVGPRMPVDRGVLLYQSVDIGDGDQDLHRATRRGFRYRQLIKISGVVVIDRRPEQTAQITNRGTGLRGGLRNLPGLVDDGRRKVRQQPMLEHCLMRDGLEVVLAGCVCGHHTFTPV